MWLGEWPLGWREGMTMPLQPMAIASRAISGARAMSISGT